MSGEDLPAVEAIYEQRVGRPPPESWQRTARQAMADTDGPSLCWVADHQQELVGYIVGAVRSWEFGSEPAGWVIGIGVSEAHQRTDVGRQLLAHLVRAFEARGVRAVRTMVQRDDVPVLRFFRSAGFASGPYTELEFDLSEGAA